LAGTGPHGASYHVIASDNLSASASNWVAVTNGTLTGGVFTTSDPLAPNHPQRFYKVTVP